MPGDRSKAIAIGMDDYVTKPVAPAALAATLRRWVGAEPDTAAEEPAPALDHGVLDGLRELDRRSRSGFLVRVTRAFLEQAPQQLATLAASVEQSDADSVALVAHSLKGSSATIGARRLAEICAELERVPLAGDRTEATARVRAAEAAFVQVQEALTAAVLSGTTEGGAACAS